MQFQFCSFSVLVLQFQDLIDPKGNGMREFFDRKRRYVALVLAVVMALMSPLSSVAQTASDEGSLNLLEALMPERELLTEQSVTAGEVPAYPASVNEEKAEEDSEYVNFASGSETVNGDDTASSEPVSITESTISEEGFCASSEPIEGIVVTVKAESGVFPEGSKLIVKKLASESETVENADAAVENAKLLGEETSETEAETEDEVSVISEKTGQKFFFDITIVDEEGNKIQPDGEVEVRFSLVETVPNLTGARVFHVEDNEEKKLEKLEEIAKKIEESEGDEEIEFPDGEIFDDVTAKESRKAIKEATEKLETLAEEIENSGSTDEPVIKETPYIAQELDVTESEEAEKEKALAEFEIFTDSFSTYVIELQYNSYTAQVNRGETISISDLLYQWGYLQRRSDVTDVEKVYGEGIDIQHSGDDWSVKIDKPFTEGRLKVTYKWFTFLSREIEINLVRKDLPVVKNNSTGREYTSLTDAFGDAFSGDTISLIDDIDDIHGPIGLTDVTRGFRNIILDLAGHKIIANSGSTVLLVCGTNLIIMNSAESTQGQIINQNSDASSSVISFNRGSFEPEESSEDSLWLAISGNINLTGKKGIILGRYCGINVPEAKAGYPVPEISADTSSITLDDITSQLDIRSGEYSGKIKINSGDYSEESTGAKITGGTFLTDDTSWLTPFIEKGYAAVKISENKYQVEETEYQVGFDSHGGSVVNPVTVKAQYPIAEPAVPVRDGYSFLGWYDAEGDEAVKWDFGNPVTGNMTLHAHWAENVAKIGNKYYSDLQTALDNLGASQTLELLHNVNLGSKNLVYKNSVASDRNKRPTINFAGHTVTADNSDCALFIQGVNLSLKDTAGTGGIINTSTSEGSCAVRCDAQGLWRDLYIDGGTYRGTTSMKLGDKLNLKINDLSTNVPTYIISSENSENRTAFSIGSVVPDIFIRDNTYINGKIVTGPGFQPNYAELSGGSYTHVPDKSLMSSGFRPFDNSITASGDYKFTVEAASQAIAENTTKNLAYKSLKDAVECAEQGDTVTLLKDSTSNTEAVEIGKTITLDLNGHTYSASGISGSGTSGAAIYTANDVVLTLKGKAGSKVQSDHITLDASAGGLVIDGEVSVIAGGANSTDSTAIISGNRLTIEKADAITATYAVEIHMDASADLPYLKNGTYTGKLLVIDKVDNTNKVHITGGRYDKTFCEQSSRREDGGVENPAVVLSGDVLLAGDTSESVGIFTLANGYDIVTNEDAETKNEYRYCVTYTADNEAYAINLKKFSQGAVTGTLASVISNELVEDGWTVRLLNDVGTIEAPSEVTINKNITLDLAGHTYTGGMTVGSAAVDIANGLISITNSKKLSVQNAGQLNISGNDTLTITGENGTENIIAVTGENSKLTISNNNAVILGSITSGSAGTAVLSAGKYSVKPDSTFIASGYGIRKDSENLYVIDKAYVTVTLADKSKEYFFDLQDAFDTIGDATKYTESTVEILKDFEGAYTLKGTYSTEKSPNKITLDFGQYGLTSTTAEPALTLNGVIVEISSGVFKNTYSGPSGIAIKLDNTNGYSARLDINDKAQPGDVKVYGSIVGGQGEDSNQAHAEGGYYSVRPSAKLLSPDDGVFVNNDTRYSSEYPYVIVKDKEGKQFKIKGSNNFDVLYAQSLSAAVEYLNGSTEENANIVQVSDTVSSDAVTVQRTMTFDFYSGETESVHIGDYKGNISAEGSGTVLYIKSGMYQSELTAADGAKIDISGENVTQYTYTKFAKAPKVEYVNSDYALAIDMNGTEYPISVVPKAAVENYEAVLSKDGAEVYFKSLILAVSNAPAGSTVTLKKDAGISSNADIREDFTLDLDGHTLTVNSSANVPIKSNLTIKNGSITGGVTGQSLFNLSKRGITITFEDVNMTCDTPMYWKEPDTTWVIKGGTYKVGKMTSGFNIANIICRIGNNAKGEPGKFDISDWRFGSIMGNNYVKYEITGGEFSLSPDTSYITIPAPYGTVKTADTTYKYTVKDVTGYEARFDGVYNPIYWETIGSALENIDRSGRQVIQLKDVTLSKSVTVNDNVVLTLGKTSADGYSFGTGSCKLSVPEGKQLTIKNGKLSGDKISFGTDRTGKVILTDLEPADTASPLIGLDTGSHDVSITGGKWALIQDNITVGASGKLAISGGNFKYKLNEEYLDTGYHFVVSGDSDYPYTVSNAAIAAEVYDSNNILRYSCDSIESALALAGNNGTVKLLDDVPASENITIEKIEGRENITIDLNGKNVPGTAAFISVLGGNVLIKGGSISRDIKVISSEKETPASLTVENVTLNGSESNPVAVYMGHDSKSEPYTLKFEGSTLTWILFANAAQIDQGTSGGTSAPLETVTIGPGRYDHVIVPDGEDIAFNIEYEEDSPILMEEIAKFYLKDYVPEGYMIGDNTDPTTKNAYPYVIKTFDSAEAKIVHADNTETYYEKLADALDSVSQVTEKETVVLLKDNLTIRKEGSDKGDGANHEPVAFTKSVILDLNKNTLIIGGQKDGNKFTLGDIPVSEGESVTIKNGTITTTMDDPFSYAHSMFQIKKGATITFEDVSMTGYCPVDFLEADSSNKTTANFTGSDTVVKCYSPVSSQVKDYINTLLQINGDGSYEFKSWFFMHDPGANRAGITRRINGGKFDIETWGDTQTGDYQYGTTTLNGGDFSISPDNAHIDIAGSDIDVPGSNKIIKNWADGQTGTDAYQYTVMNSFGEEAYVPGSVLVDGKTKNKIYYRTIGTALNDVHETKTVTLCEDATLVEAVQVDCIDAGKITLDLNGQQLSFDSTEHSVSVADDTELSFINGSMLNFYHPVESTERGTISFDEGIDFSGRFDVRCGKVRITSGRWKQPGITIDPPYDLKISGGKFSTEFFWKEYLEKNHYFFENSEDDRDVYPYLVDQGCKVTFELNDHGSEIAPATVKSGNPVAAPATPSEPGYTFDGWFTENGITSGNWGDPWNFDTPVTADTTLYAKWNQDSYNVYFNMNGHGEQVDTQSVTYGEKVVEPEIPQEEGYTFGGWFKDRSFDNAWNFTTDQVKSNMTLHAKWDQNKYEVSFDMHEHGVQIASQSVAHGGKIAEPSTPSESGYIFDGWFKEDGSSTGNWGEKWNFENDTVTAAVTLHAKWTGSAAVVIDSQNTTYYRTAEEAFAAAQNGDTVKLLKPFEVTEALTVNHSITLDLNGQTLSGSDDRYIISVENADFTVTDTSTGKTGKIENTSADPDSYAVILAADDEINEYAFTMTGGTISGYNGVVSDWNYHTLNISGGYISASGNEYSTSLSWWSSVVSLNIDGGYFKGSVEYAGAGSMTNHGNITGGYYSDKSARSYMAKGYGVLDNTVEATKKEYPYMVGPAFRVEFELNGHGDTYYDVQYVGNGGKVVKPEDPTEKGYTFDGWYTKNGMINPETKMPDWGERWNFDTDTVTEDMTLYAQWIATLYTVRFDLHGHGKKEILPIGCPYGSKVVEPEKPYEEEWVFGGWFKEDGTTSGNWGDPWNFEKDIVTSEITLHAKWDEAEASITSAKLTRPEYYTSLTAAIASASDADTVTLYKAVEAAATIVIDKNITLDLNGFSISGNLTDYVIRVDGTSLKITDSTTGDTARGRIINTSTSGNSYAVALFGDETVKDDTLIETAAIDTLTIDGVAIEGYNAIWSDFNYDGIEMSKGSITARADGIAAGFWNNCIKLDISGGEIKGMLSYEGAGGIADGYIGAITGGIYSKKPDRTFIHPEYGVADNTDETTEDAYPYKVVLLSETSYKVTYDADGGVVKTIEMTIPERTVTVEDISYGSIIPDTKQPIASWEGKVLDGWYTESKPETGEPSPECRAWDFNKDVVTEDITLYAWWSDGVAEVSYEESGTTKTLRYATFVDALEMALNVSTKEDAVLTLLANVERTEPVGINLKNGSGEGEEAVLVLDLNGKSISGSMDGALIRLTGDGKLIISDRTNTPGMIKNSAGDAVSIAYGSLIIEKGSVTGSRGAVYYDASLSKNPQVTVNGGKIKGAFSTGSLDTAHATITLNGGEYDRKSDGMTYVTLKDGCTWIYRAFEEYQYAIAPDTDKVVSYTWNTEGPTGEDIEHTEYFAAFEDAVAFANSKDSGKLTLLNDYSKDTVYVLNRDTEIDLNSHVLNGSAAGQALISVVGANLTVYDGSGVAAVDAAEAKGSLRNTDPSGKVISMSDPSKKLSIGSGRYQGSIAYENVQQGQKPAGDIYGGIYSTAPGHTGSSGEIISDGYLREGYEITDNKDTETKADYPKQVSIRELKVTFNMNGHGEQEPEQTVKYGQKATAVTPYVSDVAFEGWFTKNGKTEKKPGTEEPDWGDKWDFDTDVVTEDITLHAKWTSAAVCLDYAGVKKNYSSIFDAAADVNALEPESSSSAILTLLADISANNTLAFKLKDKLTLTLDLNGKNLTGSIANADLIEKSGNGHMIITDASADAASDKSKYGMLYNSGLKGGTVSSKQGDIVVSGGKIRGGMITDPDAEASATVTLNGGLYDSAAYASVTGRVKLDNSCVWLSRTEDSTYPYEVISSSDLAATYTAGTKTLSFNDLEKAVAYAKNHTGGVLKLENSYPLSDQTAKTLEFAGNVTLDLNGKSITVNGNDPAVKSAGKISILDSSTDKNGSINNSNGSALEVEYVDAVSKNIVISGGNFLGAVKYYGISKITALTGAAGDITGGNFSISPTDAETLYSDLYPGISADFCKFMLREGYGVTDKGSGSTYRYAVGINNYTVTFVGNGGIFTDPEAKDGKLVKNYSHGDPINQPEINKPDETKLFDGWFTKNGIPKEETGEPDWGNKWNFSTGRISSIMTLYAKWGDRIAVIKRGEEELSFSSVQDAIDAAVSGETVKVLDNVTVYHPLTVIGKELTLDLNGKTITANKESKLPDILEITNGNVTVKNGKLKNDAGGGVDITGGVAALTGLTITTDATALSTTGATTTVTGTTITSDTAAVSINGGTTTLNNSTVTGTTGITVNQQTNAALNITNNSHVTGNTGDGINTWSRQYGTPKGGKAKGTFDFKDSSISGKKDGINGQDWDASSISSADTTIEGGDIAVDWVDGGEVEVTIFGDKGAITGGSAAFGGMIGGTITGTLISGSTLLQTELAETLAITTCVIAVTTITVNLFTKLFEPGKNNEPKKEYVCIGYNANGGSPEPGAYYIVKGTPIEVAALPTKDKARATAWSCSTGGSYPGGAIYIAENNTTFTAEYDYKIEFDTDGKTVSDPPEQWVHQGGKATDPKSSVVPKDRNYTLDHWNDENGNKFDFNTAIEKSYKLKAVWKDRASVKVTAKLKNDLTSELKVDWNRNYPTLYEALAEANKPYNEIAEKALEKISLDQVDITITVTLLDDFVNSLDAYSVSGQLYETYDIKNDITLNLEKNYVSHSITEHLENEAVFTVDKESTLTIKGNGSIISYGDAFAINDDLSTKKGGSINISDATITAGRDIIRIDQYGTFNISGGDLTAGRDIAHINPESTKTNAETTGGITGGYISGGTNIYNAECYQVAITGGYYTDSAKTEFDNVGLPAGYCWKESGLPDYPWTVKKGRVVKFDAKGGTPAPEAQTVEVGDKVEKPADMSKEGFIFDAWYTKDGTENKDAAGNPDWGEKWAFETRTIADTDPNPLCLYAKWDKAVVRVDYTYPETGEISVLPGSGYYRTIEDAFADIDIKYGAIAKAVLLEDVTGKGSAQSSAELKVKGRGAADHVVTLDLNGHTLTMDSAHGQKFDISYAQDAVVNAGTPKLHVTSSAAGGKIIGYGTTFANEGELTFNSGVELAGDASSKLVVSNEKNVALNKAGKTVFENAVADYIELTNTDPNNPILIKDGKYTNATIGLALSSSIVSVSGGIFDNISKLSLTDSPAAGLSWVKNTDALTKDRYPWTVGDPVAYVSYKVIDGIARPDTYHSSLKEAFEKASADEDADNIFLLKNITIEAGDEAVFNADDEREDVYFELNEHTITVNSPTSAAITVSARNVPLTVNDSNGEAGSVIKGTGKLFSVEGGSLLLGHGVNIEGTDSLNIVEASGELTFNGAKYIGLTVEQNGGKLICDRGTYTDINLKSGGGETVYEEGSFKKIVYEVLSGDPELHVNGGIYDGNTKKDIETKREKAGYNITLNPDTPGWVDNTDESTKTDYPWTLGKVAAKITKTGIETSEPKYYRTLKSAIDDSKEGDTITLLASVSDADEGAEGYALNPDTTLDLDGHDITMKVLISDGAELKDSKESAMIRVSTISQLTVKSSNTQLPVYDNVKGGYRLFNYSFKALGVKHAKPSEGMTYHDYQLKFTTASAKEDGYRILAQGNHGLELVIKAKYKDKNDDIKQIDVTFVSERKDMIKDYGEQMLVKESKVFRSTYRAGKELPHDRTITSIAVFASSCGIQLDTENNPKTSRFYTQQ